jgi:hypothetical protein
MKDNKKTSKWRLTAAMHSQTGLAARPVLVHREKIAELELPENPGPRDLLLILVVPHQRVRPSPAQLERAQSNPFAFTL